MFTNRLEMAAKSSRLSRTFFKLSLLLVLTLPASGFANDNHSSSSSPSKASVKESDETEAVAGDTEEVSEERRARDIPERQAVKAENYNKSWDDAMVAAPAFGE